jgi:hypothetical protein
MMTRRTVLVLIAVAVSVVARAPIAFDPLERFALACMVHGNGKRLATGENGG